MKPQRSFFMTTTSAGQASAEYLIVCAAILLSLGISLTDPDSALYQHIHAFQQAYKHISFSLSLPL